MKIIATIFGILIAGHVFAAPGDILYVHGDVVNMREGPSTSSGIVLELQKGHKLVEFQRKGKWVDVGADRTGGKSGWIHSSNNRINSDWQFRCAPLPAGYAER